MASIGPSRLPPEDWAEIDRYLRMNNVRMDTSGEHVDKKADNKIRATALTIFARKFANDPSCFTLLFKNPHFSKIVLAQPEFFDRYLYYFAHFLNPESPIDPIINRDQMNAYERELDAISSLEVLAVEAHPEILTLPGALTILAYNKPRELMLANRGNNRVAMAIAHANPAILTMLAACDITGDIDDEVFIAALEANPDAVNSISASFAASRPIILAYLREEGFKLAREVDELRRQRAREQGSHTDGI